MLDRVASTISLLALGLGTLYLAWRGHVSDEFVMSRFFRIYRPNRQDNPFGFYFYLSVLVGFGTTWIVWGMLIFAGLLRPLSWR